MKTSLSKAATQRKVDACPRWYHQIEVGHGIVTPGGTDSWEKLERLKLPDIEGWSVIDVGANDGFFSFQAEKMGAARVLAVDKPHWTGEYEYGGGKTKERFINFKTAHQLRGSKIEYNVLDIYQLSPDRVGKFDLVMCLGVLYHVVHITHALENLISVADKLVVIESAIHDENIPDDIAQMVFTPGAHQNDRTNWWYPNVECLKRMMLLFGCDEVELIHPEQPGDIKEKTHRVVLHGHINS
ncbi:MAG: class I SAM-dependent methyltransferase [Candidatus Thorarchaeota archaeon]|jgi:tRNA (mo5U34)-methyltransferase